MIAKKDIGRRVIVTDLGSGTIMDFYSSSSFVIEFDESKPYFHTCSGVCKPGHGYYVDMTMITFADDEYASLKKVLKDAEDQCSRGKGKIRHANNNKYEDQVICVVGRLLKDHPFGAHAYQVIKKTIEAGRLYKIKGPEAAYQEILGAINYCAAMNILIKEGDKK